MNPLLDNSLNSCPLRDPSVEVSGLVRRFGDVQALAGVSLIVREGEFFSILGPSGCGKTTMLRIIAGLEMPDQGIVRIGGIDSTETPAHLRPVNTVFQSYALFPHMTVRENVAFGLRMKNVPKSELVQRVDRVMDMAQIENLTARKPNQLSGGQRQRVALARAIVNEPKVLLLDEPLGALDLKLRKELEVELMVLQKRLGITFIFVTHDQEEALVLSDRLAVMDHGHIEQIGDVEALYERPRTRFVGQFLGTCNLIDATVKRRVPGGAVVDTTLGELAVEFGPVTREVHRRDRFTVAIRPEKVNLVEAHDPDNGNRVNVGVKELIYTGSETHYLLDVHGRMVLRAEMMNSKVGSQGFNIGDAATVYLPPAGLIVLDD